MRAAAVGWARRTSPPCCSPICTATTSPISPTSSPRDGSTHSARHPCRSSGHPVPRRWSRRLWRLWRPTSPTESVITQISPRRPTSSSASTRRVRCGMTAACGLPPLPTDHRPVEPTIAFRIEYDGASVVLAGDTVPCATLDELASGANALVHTVIRKDLVEQVPRTATQGHPRLPLIGRAGGSHRCPSRCRHPGANSLCASAGPRPGGPVARVGCRRVQRPGGTR